MLENKKSIFDLLDEAKNTGASELDLYRFATGFLEQKARDTNTPYHGHFELTPLCNLDCKMCYVHLKDSQIQGRRVLSPEVWIALMQQAIDAGMVSASLSGGECLTYPHFDEVFLFLKSKGISVGVLTNGLLLNQERVEFFREYSPKGIQISLYGSSETAYGKVTGKQVFSTVLENIRLANQARLPIHIMISPNRYMMDDVKHVISLAKDLGVPYSINSMLVTPRKNTGREKNEFDISMKEYVDILKYDCQLNGREIYPREPITLETGREKDCVNSGLQCGSGKSGFSIHWDGSMHPCVLLESVVAYPIRDGFIPAWEYINDEVRHFPRFRKCMDCRYSEACGFCASENEKLGSRFILDPSWCENTRSMIENGLRHVDNICD